MMKLILILLLLLFSVNNDNLKEYQKKLYIFDFAKLVEKKWEYNHSFNSDTILKLDILTDLPKKISFLKCKKGDMIKEGNSILSMWKKSPLFGIYCVHDKIPFGEISYPIILENVKKDFSKVKVQHYVVKGMKFGKGYDYYITKITDNSLIIKTGKIYTDSKKNNVFYNHVYVRNKK